MKFKLTPNITKDYLLEKIGEEAIFEKYLGFRVNYDAQFQNPLRDDKDPGCRFYYNGSKIKFHDIAKKFNEDCFGIVMEIFHCNFNDALQKIANDFGLLSNNNYYSFEKQIIPKPNKDKVIIQFEPRLWTLRDQDYWGSICVGSKQLNKFEVFSVKRLFTYSNGRENRYLYDNSTLCYAYKDGNFTKIYRPELPTHKGKWFSNIPRQFYHGYKQLPESCELILITKSLKDILVADVFNIASTGPQSENLVISPNGYNLLKLKTNVIGSLFDYDSAGIECAKRHKQLYDIPYVFIESGEKDLSGLVKARGYKEGKAFINHARETFLNNLNNREFLF